MFLRPASTAGGGKRARIQHAPREERYPSDVTDAEWEIIAPMIPSQRQGGRRRETDMRDVMNAVRYVLRTGCQWRQLPKDFPPRSTVYNYFWEWTRYGVLDHIHHMLLVKVREAEGREASPTAAIIDTQAVKATEKGGLRGIRSPYRRSGRAWRQCRAARMRLLSSPAKAGEGDHTKCGGGGAWLDASLSSHDNRRVRRPSHRANARPPPRYRGAGWSRMKSAAAWRNLA
jgi:transposase